LRNAYNSLANTGALNRRDNWIVFAALNPYEEDTYFAVTEEGSFNYKVNLSSGEESTTLDKMTDDYMRMRAKQDGTTFKRTLGRDGNIKVFITPNSYRRTGAVRATVEEWMQRRNLPARHDTAFVGAVTVGAGVLSKIAGLSAIRATGVAASTGFGAALATWYRG
jgi:hypothetical protein